MPDSRREPLGQMQARLLRFGAEYRVAAAHVGHHRMRAAAGIAQRDLVFLARPAAIAIAGAGGKEPAKDAVFGVEHGQMMVGDGFQPRRIDAAGQRGDLRGVQIVRGREAAQSHREQQVGRDRVGGVQAEIAIQPDARRA